MKGAGILLGLCALLAGCGGSPPPPPAAATPKPAAAAAAPQPVAAAVATPAAPGPPAPATAKPSAAVPPSTPAPLVTMPAVPQGDGVAYEDKGRRDPFVPLDTVGGPKGLEVATAKLTGIVRGARTTLALVEAQDGIGYILKPGDTLGDGRLVEIGADTVVFVVAARPGAQSNRVVLRLAVN
jgi:hypothetical protein